MARLVTNHLPSREPVLALAAGDFLVGGGLSLGRGVDRSDARLRQSHGGASQKHGYIVGWRTIR
jgi:hypothetical protein